MEWTRIVDEIACSFTHKVVIGKRVEIVKRIKHELMAYLCVERKSIENI